MKKRGRKSSSCLSVVATELPQRANPPDYFNDYQKDIWRSTVDSKPVEWFDGGSAPLIMAYCHACDVHRTVSREIDAFDIEWLEGDDGLKRFKRLCGLQERQARLIAMISTKMRLTQQSRYTPQAAATADARASSGRKPWEG